ncbi:colanic acid biosynthesis protein WcaH [Wenyingzhuangia heitensis]|uniref:Colanic acid biosynthesis protein WcaH n=1 Tax=Wenyingzhuangia heitensis TaxID=1487859 RepID=A0ABX0UA37_9FLAO|nr:GDP-mannose mannosyl hydrolase [Wenyingzhuangia heitensis]NIJ45234.1 colanic acid biosynthesis protein WcaH [Wenyingzhuangia heitensis]
MLPEKEYTEVVKNTPLISIDLVITDADGKILLGYRLNKPAQHTWFVPGGVIRKNESFLEAFTRICEAELGFAINFSEATYVGLYEHMYPTNFANDPNFGTHYVVNAFSVNIKQKAMELPKAQHSEYWWATKEELLAHKDVHTNTKNYFNGFKPFSNY